MINTYSIQVGFGINIRDLTFKSNNEVDIRKRWDEACATLDDSVRYCEKAKEFFDVVTTHYEKYGFDLVCE